MTPTKLKVYRLTHEQSDAVDKLATEHGINQSEIIRDAWKRKCEELGVAWPDNMVKPGKYSREGMYDED